MEADQHSPALAEEIKLANKDAVGMAESWRVLRAMEGSPQFSMHHLLKLKKNLGTFFMKDKIEQFSDFIFGC